MALLRSELIFFGVKIKGKVNSRIFISLRSPVEFYFDSRCEKRANVRRANSRRNLPKREFDRLTSNEI
jgi:hypothetical protein